MNKIILSIFVCATVAMFALGAGNKSKSVPPATPAPTDSLSAEKPIPDWAKVILCKDQISAARKAGVEPAIEIELSNGVMARMVFIPPGDFEMGSPDSEQDRIVWESPQRKVSIKKGFYLCVTEVTQAQWEAVMGDNPSYFKNGANKSPKNTANHPVENISWNNIQNFLESINKKIKGKGFRLPSEAEWEYACRAGTNTRFFFGDKENDLRDYAWYNKNSDKRTHPVGEKKPNKWGLSDMYGNVWEWCEDDWHENYQNAPAEEKAWASSPRGDGRTVRGGHWGRGAGGCRSASRCWYCQTCRNKGEGGFRFIRAIEK